jgi:predicted outer membrane repeat protein
MKATALLFLAVSLARPAPLGATVIHVDQSGGDFTTIGDGIQAAHEGDTLLIAPGTYSGPMNRGLDLHGVNIVIRSLEGPGTVTIDCEDQDRAFYLHTWEDTTSVIDGLTIMRGLAEQGGAIRCYRADVRLLNVTFSGNRAHTFGGAVCLEYSATIIRHGAFVENWAGSRGGAVSLYRSPAVLRDLGFKGNVGRMGGGALHISRSGPFIQDCRFYSNRAGYGGGGACGDLLGSPYFEGCLFHRNTAPESGGAFFMEGTTPICVACRFYENEADVGGGVHLMQGHATFEACEFIGNAAESEGGAVQSELVGSVDLHGCVLERNTSEVGGAVRIERGSLTVAGCSFVNNVASLAAGAVGCWGDSKAAIASSVFSGNDGGFLGGAVCASGEALVDVMNCTLADNAAASGAGIACAGRAAVTAAGTIVAFSGEGDAVHCEEAGLVALACCDLYGNPAGDWVGCVASQYGAEGNACEDPLFCLEENPAEPYSLSEGSHCAGDNNLICGLIGARDVGCEGDPVRPVTWGAIKARFR